MKRETGFDAREYKRRAEAENSKCKDLVISFVSAAAAADENGDGFTKADHVRALGLTNTQSNNLYDCVSHVRRLAGDGFDLLVREHGKTT